MNVWDAAIRQSNLDHFDTLLPQFKCVCVYVCTMFTWFRVFCICLFMPGCLFVYLSVGLSLCTYVSLGEWESWCGCGSVFRLGLDDSQGSLLWFGARLAWGPLLFPCPVLLPHCAFRLQTAFNLYHGLYSFEDKYGVAMWGDKRVLIRSWKSHLFDSHQFVGFFLHSPDYHLLRVLFGL